MKEENDQTQTPPDKMAVLAPFAVAVAEAMEARAVWLGHYKQARWKSGRIRADEYKCAQDAYKKAKRRVREAVAEYRRAKTEHRNGGAPVLKDEWRERLRPFGWFTA